MCSRATCRSCGLATWSGCGAHVDQVMRNIPVAKRCTCERGGGASNGPRRGLMSRLLGR